MFGQAVNGPNDALRFVAKIAPDCIDVDRMIEMCEQNVTATALCSSKLVRRKHTRAYAVSAREQSLHRLLHDAYSGVRDTRDILDNDGSWTDDLGKASHTKVQSVLGVIAARVIVEI